MLCWYKFIAKIAANPAKKKKKVGKLLASKKAHETKRNSSFDWKNYKHQEIFILMNCQEVLIGIDIHALQKFALLPYFPLLFRACGDGDRSSPFWDSWFSSCFEKKKKTLLHKNCLTNYNLVIKILNFCSIFFA